MARTIQKIQDEMNAKFLADRPNLSPSKVAGWRLWTFVVAGAIHAFEVILDLFRAEVEAIVRKTTPGTVTWYREMCLRFQNGHELLFDKKTAELYYERDDPAARIIKLAAVAESRNKVVLKVATLNEAGAVVPLDNEQVRNFNNYVEAIKFAGLQIGVMSYPADTIRYRIEVYHDPATPPATVEQRIREALAEFKVSLSFDAMFYPQHLIRAVMAVDSVITVKAYSFERKSVASDIYEPVDVATQLWAGYFDYADDCVITLSTLNAGDNEP